MTIRLVNKSKESKKKRGAPKIKADLRFAWQETPKGPELFEFSENIGLTQDMPNNARTFDFFKLLLTQKFLKDCLSFDKSLILWRGRLIFCQHIKNKRHKYGIKFFELCQYDRIILRVSVYFLGSLAMMICT